MTESHDPWDEARAAQRDQVKEIFAARSGAPVTDRRREFRLSRRNLAIVLAVLAAAGVVVALVVPGQRRTAAELRAAAARHEAQLAAAERTRIIAAQRPHFVSGPAARPGATLAARRARLVAVGATAITTDARAKMRAGTISGPVAGTECRPTPDTDSRRAQERDASITKNRYECLAYERRFPLSELEGKARTGEIGVPYWLVVDYKTARLAYCQLVPRVGEGGRALAFIEVARPCADPLPR